MNYKVSLGMHFNSDNCINHTNIFYIIYLVRKYVKYPTYIVYYKQTNILRHQKLNYTK